MQKVQAQTLRIKILLLFFVRFFYTFYLSCICFLLLGQVATVDNPAPFTQVGAAGCYHGYRSKCSVQSWTLHGPIYSSYGHKTHPLMGPIDTRLIRGPINLFAQG